jgi:hypothetical protein
MSYAEKIAIIDHEKQYILFNDHIFSVTTNHHQTATYFHLVKKYPNYKKYSFDSYSINDFNFKDARTLGNGLIFSDSLIRFISEQYPTKDNEDFLHELQWKNIYRSVENAIYKSNRDKEKRLNKKIEKLDFKSIADLEKALGKNTYVKIRGYYLENDGNKKNLFSKYVLDYIDRFNIVDRYKPDFINVLKTNITINSLGTLGD